MPASRGRSCPANTLRWECPRCTLLNDRRVHVCGACDGPKPAAATLTNDGVGLPRATHDTRQRFVRRQRSSTPNMLVASRRRQHLHGYSEWVEQSHQGQSENSTVVASLAASAQASVSSFVNHFFEDSDDGPPTNLSRARNGRNSGSGAEVGSWSALWDSSDDDWQCEVCDDAPDEDVLHTQGFHNGMDGDYMMALLADEEAVMAEVLRRSTEDEKPKPSTPPLEESEIEQLPTTRLSYAQARSIPEHCKGCAVCLEDFKARDMQRTLPCLHRFHQACIDECLRHCGACPVCRHPVREDGAGTFS